MPSELHFHLHLRLPRLSRLTKIIGALVAVAALSGGIAVAAAPNHEPEPPRTPSVNAANVVTQTGYVPLTACRIADTRKAGGIISGHHVRTFFVAGTAGFFPQGGTSGGCGVPVGASAVAISVTTTHASAAGFLTLYAHGSTRPAANQTTFVKSQAITTLVNAPVALTDGRLDIYTPTTTHVVLDVAGYYREPIAGLVAADGTLFAHSAQVLSSSYSGTNGYYTVVLDRSYAGCIVVADADTPDATVGGFIVGNNVYMYSRDVRQAGSPRSTSGFTFTITC